MRKVNTMKTTWKPGKVIQGLAFAVLAGASLVTNIVIAEPPGRALSDIGPDVLHGILFPDATQLQPIKTSVKLERLRAYHARLDFLNDIESPEESKPDWQVLYIENFKNRPLADEKPNHYFKVQWLNGDKSWLKM